jgi:hypothetical protein
MNWQDKPGYRFWDRQPSISLGADVRLYEVDALGNKNAWVVGSYREEAGGPLRTYAFKGGFCC